MIRALFLAAAVAASTFTFTGCGVRPGCHIIRLPGQAPGDWAYIEGAHQWTSVIGGRLYTMGYSLRIDTTIFDHEYCIY